MRVVIATVGPLRRRRAAELTAPQYERIFEQPAGLEVLQEARDRLVDLGRVLGVTLIEVAVLVPLHFAVAVRDLHEADACLEEPTRHEALSTEGFP